MGSLCVKFHMELVMNCRRMLTKILLFSLGALEGEADKTVNGPTFLCTFLHPEQFIK